MRNKGFPNLHLTRFPPRTRTRTNTIPNDKEANKMLRAEVYARALCASQNRKEDSV
jgi:hypothetical protein